jgi:F-type H+-transporting ATPase subunit delta
VPDRRRAWARALLLAAPDGESRSAFADALEGLGIAIGEDRRIRSYLSDPATPKVDKVRLLRSAFTAGATSGAARGETSQGAQVFERFCALIVEKGRTELLPQIARSYREFSDAEAGIARLEIEAAREVPQAVLERIAAAWTSYAHVSSTAAKVRVNPALIAGYRLRAGSLRIDYSVAGRLERLRRELARPLEKSSAQPESPTAGARGEG